MRALIPGCVLGDNSHAIAGFLEEEGGLETCYACSIRRKASVRPGSGYDMRKGDGTL